MRLLLLLAKTGAPQLIDGALTVGQGKHALTFPLCFKLRLHEFFALICLFYYTSIALPF